MGPVDEYEAVGRVQAFVDEQLAAGERLKAEAARLGVTVEELQAWELARDSGVSIEEARAFLREIT